MICRECGNSQRDPKELRQAKIIRLLLLEGLSVERLSHILGMDLGTVGLIARELTEDRRIEEGANRFRDSRDQAYK